MSDPINISVEVESVFDISVTPEGDVADISVTQEAEEVIEIVVESGVPGARGYTGSVGAGYVGSRGAAGFVGSAGSAGSNGFTGSRGLAGEYAALGYTGSKGDIGSLGYTGSSGAGFVGSRGFVGSQGIDGDIGPIGYTGSFGARGYTGSRGLLGYAGSKGEEGVGFVGSRGVQGVIGFTGSKGEQGDTGFVGSRGLFGYTGSVGVGFVGSKGTVGFVGSKGALGYTGSAGSGGSTSLGLFDFWNIETFSTTLSARPSFTGAALTSGTVNAALPSASLAGYNPHGIFVRAAAGGNSGYRFMTSSLVSDYFGVQTHKFRCQWMPRGSFTEMGMRVGYFDVLTIVEAITDGAYFESVGSTVYARTANNSSVSSNATSYTMSLDTIYTFDIEVNAAGTSARFRIYAGTNTTPVLDVTNTANIPTSSTYTFGCGFVAACENSGGVAQDIGILYKLGFGTVAAAAAAGIT